MPRRSLITAWMLRTDGAAALLLGSWLLSRIMQGEATGSPSGALCVGALATVLGPMIAVLLGLIGAMFAIVGATSIAASAAVLRRQAARWPRWLLWLFAFAWGLASAGAALVAAAPQVDLGISLLVAAGTAAVSLLHVSATQWNEAAGPAAAAGATDAT